jgi:hypothetical protein
MDDDNEVKETGRRDGWETGGGKGVKRLKCKTRTWRPT